MTTAHDYASQHADTFRSELHHLLKFPSVSTDPAFAANVKEAADWLVENFRNIGLEAELITFEGQHPLVYAEYMGAGEAAKTVLVYGHYDVQPAIKADGWDTDPFDPVEKNGKIYARGATDDKGQFFIHVKAVEALLKSDDPMPVNIKYIIEGEEESGSGAMNKFVNEHPEKLQADVCVISDTSMATMEQPVIINALRGTAKFELSVRGPSRDLHSGMYGGTVHNPLQALAEIITQLHDDDGTIAVPNFYEDVVPLTDADREEIAKVPWDNIDWAEETGAPLAWGDADYSLRERVGARPTLEINGMAGGYYGDGFKAIVPASAHAKISCRLVANQSPQKIGAAMLQHIRNIAPPTVEVELQFLGGSPAVLVNTDSPYIEAAVNAYANGWGATPIFKREGGSIPIVSAFQNKLNLPVILMGFGLNSDGLHGPNEHFSIDMFHKGIDTAIYFLQEVATVRTPPTENQTP